MYSDCVKYEATTGGGGMPPLFFRSRPLNLFLVSLYLLLLTAV